MTYLEKLIEVQQQIASFAEFLSLQEPEFFDSEKFVRFERELERLRTIKNDIEEQRIQSMNKEYPQWQVHWPSGLNKMEEGLYDFGDRLPEFGEQ